MAIQRREWIKLYIVPLFLGLPDCLVLKSLVSHPRQKLIGLLSLTAMTETEVLSICYVRAEIFALDGSREAF